MGRYTVGQSYSSWRDGDQYGPWEAGTEIELDDADAAWVERDAPGTLTPVVAQPDPEKKPARSKAAAANRQHRGGTNRSGS
jgi:hypothetical protein